MPLPLDPRCMRARGSCLPAGFAVGKPAWLDTRRRARAAALAGAGAPAAIDATTGVGLAASGRTTNAAQQRLTPGLHIRSPH